MNIKKQGLSSEEVKELLEKYGENIIEEKKYNPLKEFLKKFVGPIPVMIEIALVLSAFAHKWEDFTIILVLLAVNIGVEFLQESKAQKVLESLKNNLALKSLVLRDGKFQEIESAKIVPGDIVKLNIGDIFPADGLILKANSASVNQSTVTGESLPVEKKIGDEVYSGTIVEKGQILIEITKTGSKSSMGKIVSLIKKGEEEEISHFQKAILSISKFLIVLSVVMIIITSIFLYYRGDNILEILRFALVLAIASIPIALPAVLSVTMAIGAGVLARKKALVSNLKAVEELAGIDQLCVDKTGTLTKNKIEVIEPKVFNDFSLKNLFTFSYLALEEENKNPIEQAIKKYTKENNLLKNIEEEKKEIKKIIPFDPIRKRTEVILKNRSTLILGAPQIVAEMLSDEKEKNEVEEENALLAEKGIRTILLAIKENNQTKIVGVIPLLDPPRDDSKEVIQEVKNLGVKIKMLTGDNIAIAKHIAKLLNIGKNVIENSFLNGVGKDDRDNLIKKTDVFAEVVPEDKFNIVSALQAENHIVAMTGDGVNDAPALKKADVGIAVSGASQAARSSADIILLSEGLSVIKDAIKIARETFWRMQSYTTFRISETIRVILFISLSIIFFGSEPLTAVMIILLALLNDIPVIAIAYDNAKISEKPVRWHLKETLTIASILGATGLISSFGLFYYLREYTDLSLAIIQTIIFLKLDVAGHSTLYLTRAGKKHFWEKPYPSLKFFIPAYSSRLIGMVIVYFGILMTPISLGIIGLVWVYAISWFLINDQIKVLAWKILDRAKEKKTGLVWEIIYKK